MTVQFWDDGGGTSVLFTPEGLVAMDPLCCCDIGECCGRLLPSTLYLEITNIPLGPDPLPPFGFSSCCADGLVVPLTLCQYIPADPPAFQGGPNVWRTPIGGVQWCAEDTRFYAEWQCVLPGEADCETAGPILRIYIDAGCDSDFISGGFICEDTCPACSLNLPLGPAELISCQCGDGTSTFLEYIYETVGLFGTCCLNGASIGPKIQWKVYELSA